MDTKTFNAIRTIVYDHSGILLAPGKENLVSGRLSKRMRKLNIPDIKSYLTMIETDKTESEIMHLLDAISTNVTSFFREIEHFEYLSEALSGWADTGHRRFRIWSAASSTGEEPYSIAITALEALGASANDFRILGSDISTQAIQACIDGIYEERLVQTIPKHLRLKYFTAEKSTANKGAKYTAKDVLKKMIVMRRINLSKPPYPMRGPLDVVFCRNVMIYFDNHVRQGFIDEAYRLLKPGGYLFVGHTESLAGIRSPFKTIKPSIYLKE